MRFSKTTTCRTVTRLHAGRPSARFAITMSEIVLTLHEGMVRYAVRKSVRAVWRARQPRTLTQKGNEGTGHVALPQGKT